MEKKSLVFIILIIILLSPSILQSAAECCSIVGDDSVIICNGAEWGMCFVCMLQKGVLVLFIKTTTAEHAALISTKHSHYPTV